MGRLDNDQIFSILLIEDDDAHAEIVRRFFSGTAVTNRVLRVADGQMALDYLYRQGKYSDTDLSPRPDLILLDLRLPKVNGLTVLNVIKSDSDLLRIPTVVLSTSSADDDRARAYESHANSYLVKPADLSKFTSMMESLGSYWLEWNTPSI